MENESFRFIESMINPQLIRRHSRLAFFGISFSSCNLHQVLIVNSINRQLCKSHFFKYPSNSINNLVSPFRNESIVIVTSHMNNKFVAFLINTHRNPFDVFNRDSAFYCFTIKRMDYKIGNNQSPLLSPLV